MIGMCSTYLTEEVARISITDTVRNLLIHSLHLWCNLSGMQFTVFYLPNLSRMTHYAMLSVPGGNVGLCRSPFQLKVVMMWMLC